MKKIIIFILFTLFILGTVSPFFKNGFFPMHDDTQVARMHEMGKALSDGMFPVRWSNDLGYGYGYPLFNFYAPFAYYLGGFIVFLGFTALAATKTIMALGILLAGFTMYLFAKKLWGSKGGLIAGALYMYATYHAVDIFVRGDLAELWAYGLLPLIFYGLLQISRRKSWLYVSITSLSYAALICSHNLSALMVTPVIFLWAIWVGIQTDRKTGLLLGISLLIGLLLSGFYFLPALTEMTYTNVLSQIGGGADFHNHFVCIQQLWYSPWGFGGSVPGCTDGLSFMLGKVAFIFSAVGLLCGIIFLKKAKKEGILILLFSLGLLLSLFLTTSYSQILWDSIKVMAFFQYPWRFLFLASFFSSIVGGYIFFVYDNFFPKTSYKNLAGFILLVIMAGIIYIYQAKLFVPQRYIYQPSTSYVSQNELQWRVSKTSDEYMPPQFAKPKDFGQIPQDLVTPISGKAITVTNKTQKKIIDVSLPSGQVAQIHLAYFPGWEMKIDNRLATFGQTPMGMFVLFPSGTHRLSISYKETYREHIGDFLSLAGILGLIVGIIYTRKKNHGKN